VSIFWTSLHAHGVPRAWHPDFEPGENEETSFSILSAGQALPSGEFSG
jgi:hypothetical protein